MGQRQKGEMVDFGKCGFRQSIADRICLCRICSLTKILYHTYNSTHFIENFKFYKNILIYRQVQEQLPIPRFHSLCFRL